MGPPSTSRMPCVSSEKTGGASPVKSPSQLPRTPHRAPIRGSTRSMFARAQTRRPGPAGGAVAELPLQPWGGVLDRVEPGRGGGGRRSQGARAHEKGLRGRGGVHAPAAREEVGDGDRHEDYGERPSG